MKKLLLILFLLASAFAYSQEQIGVEDELYSDSIYTVVDSMPTHPNCQSIEDLEKRLSCSNEAITNHIATQLAYPEKARIKGIEGIVYLKFLINQHGNVEDVVVIRGVIDGKDLEEESIRVIEALPQFQPGVKDGERIKVQYVIPIKFNLAGGKKSRKG